MSYSETSKNITENHSGLVDAHVNDQIDRKVKTLDQANEKKEFLFDTTTLKWYRKKTGTAVSHKTLLTVNSDLDKPSSNEPLSVKAQEAQQMFSNYRKNR